MVAGDPLQLRFRKGEASLWAAAQAAVSEYCCG